MKSKYKCIINEENFSDISEIAVRKLLKTKYQISDTIFLLINEYIDTASIRQQLHVKTGSYQHELDIYIQKIA